MTVALVLALAVGAEWQRRAEMRAYLAARTQWEGAAFPHSPTKTA